MVQLQAAANELEERHAQFLFQCVLTRRGRLAEMQTFRSLTKTPALCRDECNSDLR